MYVLLKKTLRLIVLLKEGYYLDSSHYIYFGSAQYMFTEPSLHIGSIIFTMEIQIINCKATCVGFTITYVQQEEM